MQFVRNLRQHPLRYVMLVLLTAFCIPGAVPAVAEETLETPKEIVAVEVRKKGFACDHPESATHDAEQSKPDKAVWILKCESGSYRVVLHADMAPNVESLD